MFIFDGLTSWVIAHGIQLLRSLSWYVHLFMILVSLLFSFDNLCLLLRPLTEWVLLGDLQRLENFLARIFVFVRLLFFHNFILTASLVVVLGQLRLLPQHPLVWVLVGVASTERLPIFRVGSVHLRHLSGARSSVGTHGVHDIPDIPLRLIREGHH